MANDVRQCLTDLMRADTSGDYQKALQAANKCTFLIFQLGCKLEFLLMAWRPTEYFMYHVTGQVGRIRSSVQRQYLGQSRR